MRLDVPFAVTLQRRTLRPGGATRIITAPLDAATMYPRARAGEYATPRSGNASENVRTGSSGSIR